MTKNQVIALALHAIREYDQLGFIQDHKLVLRELVKSLPDEEDLQEQIAVSGMLMLRAIERAKER